MRRSWRSVHAGYAAAVCLAFAGSALSQEQATTLPGDAEYVVAADCPPRSIWLGLLQSRLDASVRSEAARFHVHVRRGQARGASYYTGQLAASDVPRSEARRVTGETCSEVLDALALIASLELRRHAAAVPANDVPELRPPAEPADRRW